MKQNKSSVKQSKYLWIPFKVLFIYIFSTLMLSLFGPIEFRHFSPSYKLITFLYIVWFLFLTWIGMRLSVSYKPKFTQRFNHHSYTRICKLISSAIVITLIIKALLLISTIQTEGFPNISRSLTGLAEIYTSHKREETFSSLYRQMDTFTSFLSYIAIIGGLYVWKDLTKRFKITLIMLISIDLVYDLFFIGTQRAIFSYFLYFLMVYSVRKIQSRKGIRLRNKIIFVISVIAVFYFFSSVLLARVSYWGAANVLTHSNGLTYNLDNPFLWIIPKPMRYQVTMMLSYVTQGYYGLSLTLNTPFEWTFFLGAFRGFNSILSQIIPFVPNFMFDAYPVRAELYYGYPGLGNWHTIFPWLASDFTFVGALIFMAIFAYFYMILWKQTIRYHNPLAFILVTIFTIQYIFIPANNQLFIGRGDAVALPILFIYWLIKGKYYNYSNVD